MTNNRDSISDGAVPQSSHGLIQIHRDIHYRNATTVGLSVAVGIGIMGVLGRLVFSYTAGVNFMSYLWLLLFTAPLLLTYTERTEALSASGGLFGLMRKQHGLIIAFLVGWLELGGYATVIAILARVVSIYGLTLYKTIGGQSNVSIILLSAIVIVIFFIAQAWGWRGVRSLSEIAVSFFLALLFILGIYSLFNHHETVQAIPGALQTVKPLQLAALLFSSFWGVVILFGFRHRLIKRGEQAMLRSSASVVVVVTVIGGLLSLVTAPAFATSAETHALTINTYFAIIFQGNVVITALIALLSLILAAIGLNRVIQASAEVVSLMTEDAYFPAMASSLFRRIPLLVLLLVAIPAILFLTFIETMTLVGVAAALLLWATILIHFPDVLAPKPRLPERRPFSLPYHPLFPALTVVSATIVTVNLKFDVLKWAAIWVAIGVVALSVNSYRNALKKRGRERTFSKEGELADHPEVSNPELRETPVVMVFIRDTADVSRMLLIGRKLAKSLSAILGVMQIVEVPESLTEEDRRRIGRQTWLELARAMQEEHLPEDDDLIVKPMVRLTSTLIRGVINAAQEVRPEYLLIPPDFASDDPLENLEEYDDILRQAPGNIIFMNEFPFSDALNQISVLMGMGNHAPATLPVARALLADDGIVEVIHVLEQRASRVDAVEVEERLRSLLLQYDIDEAHSNITILHLTSLEDVVHELVTNTDLLLLGAAKNFMSRRATFGGVNAHIFQSKAVPTMLVRVYEKLRMGWISRLWETLTRPLPDLTIQEREEMAAEIIDGAKPSIDFFILILLSSGIAMYGLLQNSGAVIIGAMLVAPLMSPIIALGMSMVRGDVKNLGVAAQTTAQGVLLAIAVGAVLTFFSPIRGTTNEIMGRVSPNLLDLGIAFLSGAAGGYAMSRKSIAAALPGVAIAAALVPPLAVVGYGFATADVNIAVGALLLFITNLIAIVFAASLVFLAMDFLTPEKQTWGDVMRGLKITSVFLVFVVIILGWVTYDTVAEQRRLRAIQDVLAQSLYTKSFEPLSLDIKETRSGYTIKATLLSYDKPLSSKEVQRLGKELEAAVGSPVSADIKVIPAQKNNIYFDTTVTEVQIQEGVRDALAEKPLEVLSVEVDKVADGYTVALAVMEFKRNALSQQLLNDLEKTLAEQVGAPVKIDAYSILADKFESSSPSISTPTPTPAE